MNQKPILISQIRKEAVHSLDEISEFEEEQIKHTIKYNSSFVKN